MTLLRVPFQTQMRAAAVELLREFGAEYDLPLSVYPGRPRTIKPPHAFVDRLTESIEFSGHVRQRIVRVEVIVLHGLFDSEEAVAQKDRFVDAFVDWASDRYHAASARTVLEPRAVEDDPEYVPAWQPEANQRPYYATVITLEGFAGG